MGETTVKDCLVKLEKNLVVDGGRWVADFIESFWEYSLGDLAFDLFIRAFVRSKGIALFRSQAWLTIPNYQVACFAYSKDPQLKYLYAVLTTISTFVRESAFAWA